MGNILDYNLPPLFEQNKIKAGAYRNPKEMGFSICIHFSVYSAYSFKRLLQPAGSAVIIIKDIHVKGDAMDKYVWMPLAQFYFSIWCPERH